jgi:hypothetical protein
MDDITFVSDYFFLDFPLLEVPISAFDLDGNAFSLRLALPERISIG